MEKNVLVLPGYGNSSKEHWQSVWECKNPHFKRVHQKDWLLPEKEAWVKSLEKMLSAADGEVILVAHSIACLVVAHWASCNNRTPIKGALLVGVPDVCSASFPKEALGFENTPLYPFDFPSIVVASTNDIYASIEYAQHLAQSWGSEFVNIGAKGHINADSGLGFWDEGWALLEKLDNGFS